MYRNFILFALLIALSQSMTACVSTGSSARLDDGENDQFVSIKDGSFAANDSEDSAPQTIRTSIRQIDSFQPAIACRQAVEVVENNPYDQQFFEDVFARLVEQSLNSKSPENAETIWQEFVTPLHKSGKVPPDLATTLWNYHFSKQFASLPDTTAVTHYCRELSAVKKNLEKEYSMKQQGFAVSDQGAPDTHFLNAMYVYNTMWASCNATN